MLIDSHAHIHFKDSYDDLPDVLRNARDNGVTRIITVGTDLPSSQAAIDLAINPEFSPAQTGVSIYATVGLHPHDAKIGAGSLDQIAELARNNVDKIVAIGECGLDYHYDNSPRTAQLEALDYQIRLAQELKLPLVFHVRDAFEDFFAVLDKQKDIRGVIHSFTGGPREVEKANQFGLYFGLNGIMTFTKNREQLNAAKQIPADKLLLETDCPFLSPAPLRGKRNEPANVVLIAKFLADLRGVELGELAEQTSTNAKKLLGI